MAIQLVLGSRQLQGPWIFQRTSQMAWRPSSPACLVIFRSKTCQSNRFNFD